MVYNNSNKKKFEDGIYDISGEDYHNSQGFSRSQIMLMDKSPYHFWYDNLSGLAQKKEPTPAMIIGSVFHTLLLEPHLFDKEYVVMPKVDRRTTAGKHQWEMFEEFAKGKIILTSEQHLKASHMADLVRQHEIVTTLLDESVFEKSVYWTDEETGLQFKVRPDIWSEKMVVDVKTTQDANNHSFTRSALKYGYYLQAGMIYEACQKIGKKFDMFVHLVIEKDEPFVPSTYIMHEDALQFGIDQFQVYKRKLKKCFETNQWPGYSVQELTVPGYAIISSEEE